MYRIIFHIDLNCFYAACEIAEDKRLINRPVVIAKNDPLKRGMILTSSYEARRYGIKTTMSIKEAYKLCPGITIIEPHHDLYCKYSNEFFKYLFSITPKVEPMSIDEGFLDMTDIVKEDAYLFAEKMQKHILEVIGLPCSIGIGPNKFLAKMASDMKKPLGITILRKRDVENLMWPLPISDMLGVGKKTCIRLDTLGIKTIKDLATYPNKKELRENVGVAMFEYISQRCYGIDDSPVEYDSLDDISSVSNENTFSSPVTNIRYIKETLKILTNSVSNRLIEKKLGALTVGIKIRFDNFTQINRSRGLSVAINDNIDMWEIIEDLFDDNYNQEAEVNEVRLVGVFCTRLIDMKTSIRQYSLFDDFENEEKKNKVDRLLKSIQMQYGKDAINLGIKEENKDE